MLVVGDSHIRERADEIPKEFYEYFSSNSYDIVIHTGDLVDPDVIDLFKNFGKEFYMSKEIRITSIFPITYLGNIRDQNRSSPRLSSET